MSAQVWVLHAVDTEGPLFESAEETVARINRSCGLRLPPRRETLDALRAGSVDVGDARDAVAIILKYSSFLSSWGEIESMLDRVGSSEFRGRHADSTGRHWIYNWHVMDHVGYEKNPRRRDIGFGNVFEYYHGWLSGIDSEDQLGFHFHPDHAYPYAYLCGTVYDPASSIHAILTHHLVDREWFPKSFRAGFHAERPDSHAFLEQWIPHDFSNQAIEDDGTTANQLDVDYHRFGDWKRAPKSWGWYHPHHDDYQRPGGCRRRIFRCLNMGTRLRCIQERDVRAAFEQAAATDGPVWLCVTNHDFRDMAPDVEWLHAELERASGAFRIPWHIGNIDDTFSMCREAPVEVRWRWEKAKPFDRLHVDYSGPTFGPQPYLAMKLVNEIYRRDNFDIIEPFRSFCYTFDENSVPLARIDDIVIGANDRGGNVLVTPLRRAGRNLER